VFEIHIERVEAAGLGDPGNFDAANKPHEHRCHDFVARELLFDIVAHNLARCERHWRMCSLVPGITHG